MYLVDSTPAHYTALPATISRAGQRGPCRSEVLALVLILRPEIETFWWYSASRRFESITATILEYTDIQVIMSA